MGEILKVNKYRLMLDDVENRIFVAKIKRNANNAVEINFDSPQGKNPAQFFWNFGAWEEAVSKAYIVINGRGYGTLDHRFKRARDFSSKIINHQMRLIAEEKSPVQRAARVAAENTVEPKIYHAGYDASTRMFGIYEITNNQAVRTCCIGSDESSFAANWVSYLNAPKRKLVVVGEGEDKTFFRTIPESLMDLNRFDSSRPKQFFHDKVVTSTDFEK